jgi:ABC transport system ATP-binding/permease protein
MILIDAEKISASRPDRPLFTDLSLTLDSGDRLGVVGINGCGKSTLLRMLSDQISPESGVIRKGRGVQIAMLAQEPKLTPGTVRSATVAGFDESVHWEAEAVLDRLGMGSMFDTSVSVLSGGQAKRVALARVLISGADLLILDEPTNHLDLDAIAWLEDRLARERSGLIMVTHDRHVLDRVCTKVLEIDRGSGYIHVGSGSTGGYQAYLEGRELREEQTAASEATRRNLAKTELAWLRRGAPARTRKPKAHIESAKALIESRPKEAARAGALEFNSALGRSGEGQGKSASAQQGSFRQGVDERMAPRLGNKVVELYDVGHRFGEGVWLFRDLEWLLEPGGRYGIVGGNGTGKSTLLEIIAGRLAPAAGTVEVGPTVRLGYYDQLAREFDPKQRVREAVAGSARPVGTPEDKKLMEQFWFDDDLQFAQIGTLSGGERRRLQLLLVLAERPNVLLLDEPTNDLDLDTLRMIEAFLEEWPGTLVVVSHDRAFMDRSVEDVVAIEQGKAALVFGGYAGWRDQRAANKSNAPIRSTVSVGPAVSPDVASSTKPVQREQRTESVPATKTGRSASTLRQLMKETEKVMTKATKQRDVAQVALDAAVATGDHAAMATAGATMAEAQALIDGAEEQWLELAAEAES